MDKTTECGVERRVVQPRRLHALLVPIAMVVVAIVGMAVAGVRTFSDGGYILLLVAVMVAVGSVYVLFNGLRAPILEADTERVVVRSMFGRRNVVETKNCELVVSVDYIGFRSPQVGELAVQRGFFGLSEWHNQIKKLRTLPFKNVIEEKSGRD